jgi:hypothetical protein
MNILPQKKYRKKERTKGITKTSNEDININKHRSKGSENIAGLSRTTGQNHYYACTKQIL